MAIEAHLNALNTRRQDIKETLTQELKKPCRDEFKIIELKRQKLKLKDEISKLRRRTN